MWVWPLGCEDPLEEEMGTHSRIIAWEIPWTDEAEGYNPLVSQRVRHNGAIEHTHILFPLHYSFYYLYHFFFFLYQLLPRSSKCESYFCQELHICLDTQTQAAYTQMCSHMSPFVSILSLSCLSIPQSQVSQDTRCHYFLMIHGFPKLHSKFSNYSSFKGKQ